jgi:hypothetical protein
MLQLYAKQKCHSFWRSVRLINIANSMRPQREEEQCCVLSGGAIIGSSFYRNISLNKKRNKNKKVFQAALVNKNCIKQTMYGNNRMENMSMKLTILQCTIQEESVILNEVVNIISLYVYSRTSILYCMSYIVFSS